MLIRVVTLVLALASLSALSLQASPENPGRIVAVETGHVFFENGDVYVVGYSPALSLTYVGNVYRALGITAGGTAGSVSGTSPGVAPEAGISPSSSSTIQRCAAITRKGTQCSRAAKPGSIYCWQHQR